MSSSSATHSHEPMKLNRDLWTRNLSIVGLVLAWGVSIASLATGIIVVVLPNANVPEYLARKMFFIGSTPHLWMKAGRYPAGHRIYRVNEIIMTILPPIIQLLITLISGCLDSIHSTTLRWALWHEGRLRYNSNLRLFTSSKRNGPNKWPANIIATIGLVLANGGTSILIFPVSVTAIVLSAGRDLQFDYDIDGIQDRNGIDFNGWGLIGLGAGLLPQSIISTWALLDSAYVGTWNSNPIATAKACRIMQDSLRDPLQSHTQFSLPSFHFESDIELLPTYRPPPSDPSAKPTFPVLRQPSALTHCPQTRTLTNLLHTTTSLLAIFTITISILATRRGASPSSLGPSTTPHLIHNSSGHNTPWYTFQFFGVEYDYNGNPFADRIEYICLLIQCAVLTIPLFGLHVAELLVQMQKDEKIWRQAATKGVDVDGSLILQGAKTWEVWFILLSKAAVPWLMGLGVVCDKNLYLLMLPMVTLTVLFLVLGGVVEYLARRRPRGTQPAAYGDVLMLGELVDEWREGRLYWVDKGV